MRPHRRSFIPGSTALTRFTTLTKFCAMIWLHTSAVWDSNESVPAVRPAGSEQPLRLDRLVADHVIGAGQGDQAGGHRLEADLGIDRHGIEGIVFGRPAQQVLPGLPVLEVRLRRVHHLGAGLGSEEQVFAKVTFFYIFLE